MGSFIVSLLLLFGLQFIVLTILQAIGFTSVVIEIVGNLIFAIIFSFFDFRGKEKIKNPAFHSRIATYFIIMSLLSWILGLY